MGYLFTAAPAKHSTAPCLGLGIAPLGCQPQPVHHKGDQPWMFIGRTDVEAETPILWLPDGKSRLHGKDPDAGKD